MRTTTKISLTAAMLLGTATGVSANPYQLPQTPCSGSWDGPGLSACELIGHPGLVGTFINGISFAEFGDPNGVLWSITARPPQSFTRAPDGNGWIYSNGIDTFTTSQHPQQFAIWEDEQGIILGVEDLRAGDWDYNDYVVRMARVPESVPEPGNVTLLGAAFLAVLRKFWK